MALEDITSGDTIKQLAIANPAAGDDVSQGDDHIRNIKKALQYTWPGISATVSGSAAEFALAHKGGTISGALTVINEINEAMGSDITASVTTDIANATGNYNEITGSASISSFGTIAAGARRTIRFKTSGAIIKHDATKLILPDDKDIITHTGYVADLVSLGSGNWVMLNDRARRPSFSVHKNAVDQTIPNSTYEKVTWSTELFDTNSNFASSTFTPTVAGKYLLEAHIAFGTVSSGSINEVHIYKNGTSINQARLYSSTGAVAWQSLSVTIVVDANGSSDYFDVYVYGTTATSFPVEGDITKTWFSGCKID